MNEQIKQLEQRIQNLERENELLKRSSTIPLGIDQALRDRFSLDTITSAVTGTGTGSASTQSVAVASTPTLITVPAQPTGTLKVKYNGVTYELLYK